MPGMAVDVLGSSSQQQALQPAGQQRQLALRIQCASAPAMLSGYVWLYADPHMAAPIEAWQVFVHCLRKVRMSSEVGQTSSSTVMVQGGTTHRRVACYSSHHLRQDELQLQPPLFDLLPAQQTELHLVHRCAGAGSGLLRGLHKGRTRGVGARCVLRKLCHNHCRHLGNPSHAAAVRSPYHTHVLPLPLRPLAVARRWLLVHLVDVDCRQLVQALLVEAEGRAPPISRTFQARVAPSGQARGKHAFDAQSTAVA